MFVEVGVGAVMVNVAWNLWEILGCHKEEQRVDNWPRLGKHDKVIRQAELDPALRVLELCRSAIVKGGRAKRRSGNATLGQD